MNPITIRHQAIAASAGSGKTFALAHRFIRLLALGVAPERIVALTFSRKAAAEIFDSIIKYLCEASMSDEAATAMNKRLQLTGLRQTEYLRLLRNVLDQLSRLHVGTLDSFTIGVVSAFPMELGISADLQIMDNEGALAKAVRWEVLNRVLNPQNIRETAQQAFLEAFKQATFGREEKGLGRNLDDLLESYRNEYMSLPRHDAWGSESAIWPDGAEWRNYAGKTDLLAIRLKEQIEEKGWDTRFEQALLKFVEFAGSYDDFSAWPSTIENAVFQSLLNQEAELKQGSVKIVYYKKEYELTGELAQGLYQLIQHLKRVEIRRCLRQTYGLFSVLDQYERLYDEHARRRGRLTFADAQYLLTGNSPSGSGRKLSCQGRSDELLYIDYRLDSKLDHWLLDEFQDTSNLQWEVLQNLVSEVLQDDSGTRSFFYVGDVKQAIHGWRGGNARLFGRILEEYGPLFEEVPPLVKSFRSAKPIIEVVNQVFENLPEEVEWPEGLRESWEELWQTHSCQEKAVPAKGYATLIEPINGADGEKPEATDRYRVLARILKEVDPLARGLSTAVLVRTNAQGAEIVNYLRRECPGLAVVHEGHSAIMDSPVVSVLLSLVKFAAHPGDTMAWYHLLMSPLKDCFLERQANREFLSIELLEEIRLEGFREFLRTWGQRLNRAAPLDDFGKKRWKDLVNAAGLFDQSHEHDADSFLYFMEHYTIYESTSENAVRVMTIHQSKGLGFDLVLLPDLQDQGIISAGVLDCVVGNDPESEQPLWALKMPRRIIANMDPVLREQVIFKDRASCFEELCVLYVALTRARRAMYLITSPVGSSSKAEYPATLVKRQLAGEPRPKDGRPMEICGETVSMLYETGQPDWYKDIPVQVKVDSGARTEKAAPIPKGGMENQSRLMLVEPSAVVEGVEKAGQLFAPAVSESLDFGTAVHELFERMEWLDEAHIEKIIRDWMKISPLRSALKSRVMAHFQSVLKDPGVREILSKPDGAAELWREKPFELIVGGKWISGIFDRVVIRKDAKGKPVSAIVLDYKSNHIHGEDDIKALTEQYTPQLALYGWVLSSMLGLKPSAVRRCLLFTKTARIVEISQAQAEKSLKKLEQEQK
jgi:ATP-dependent helicase/nuclease subunit A